MDTHAHDHAHGHPQDPSHAHVHGHMDIREQERTFSQFIQAIMVLCAVVIVALLFMALVNA